MNDGRRRTLVTGSRGAIGGAVIRRLHAAGHEVRAAGRVPEALDVPDGVHTVPLDLAAPGRDAERALDGVDDVFLYAEPAGIEPLVEAMVAASVRRVVLLSSDSVGMPDAETNAIALRHLSVERALAGAGLSATLLRPGTFASLAVAWAGPIRAGLPIERAYPDAVLSPVHPDDIADVAEHALRSTDLDGARVPLYGPEPLTTRDQLAVLGELLGRDVVLEEEPPESARSAMAGTVGPELADALIGYWAYAAEHPASSDEHAGRITGRPARTFRDWAVENLAAFT